MLSYLRCIKSHRGSNDPECRGLSKSYLSCRMDRYVHRPFLLLIWAPLPCHQYPILLLRGARKGAEGSCDTDLSKYLSTRYLEILQWRQGIKAAAILHVSFLASVKI
jgi:hypothetical protein